MAIKQLKATLQAQSTVPGQTVTVAISVNNEVKFNQSIPETGPVAQNIPGPVDTFEFDIDVPVLDVFDDPEESTVILAISVTSSSGTIMIENLSNNFYFSAVQDPEDPEKFIPKAGTATDWRICQIVSQPLWNGVAILDRYNIEYNIGPIQVTGPGEVYIADGETVTFDLQVNKYNDTPPPPSPPPSS